MCDITDKEFEEIYLPFYNNVNNYLNNYVIPVNGKLIPKNEATLEEQEELKRLLSDIYEEE